jgi:hypothetical protein
MKITLKTNVKKQVLFDDAGDSLPLLEPGGPMLTQPNSYLAIRILFIRASNLRHACKKVVVALISYNLTQKSTNSLTYGTPMHTGGGFRAVKKKQHISNHWKSFSFCINIPYILKQS